jgi:hypothetical protein
MSALEELRVHVRLKLAALWTSLMLCYIYGDYFGLYKPGKLEGMLQGQMGPLGRITQGVLLETSILMAIPAVMVSLSLVLSARVNRWANIVLGLAYTVIMLITIPGAWAFYIFLGVVEVLLSSCIAWTAWKWPRMAV